MSEDTKSGAPKSEDQTNTSHVGISAKVTSFLTRESVLLALLTGVSYHATFKFDEAYLRYFGIDDIFIEIDVAGIIVAGSSIVILLTAIYYFSNILPLIALKRVAEFLFVYPYVAVPLVVCVISISISGFSNTSMFLLAYFLVVAPLSALRLRKKIRNGETWEDMVSEAIQFDGKYRDEFLGSRLLDGPYGNLVLVAVSIVFASSAIGSWAGHRAASRQMDFSVATYEGRAFAIVGSYRDLLIGVQVLNAVGGQEGEFQRQLSGEFRFFDNSQIVSNIQFESSSMRIEQLSVQSTSSLQWITLPQFFERAVNHFVQ